MKAFTILLILFGFFIFPQIVYSGGYLIEIIDSKQNKGLVDQVQGWNKLEGNLSTKEEVIDMEKFVEKITTEGFIKKLLWSLFGGFIGAVIALWLEKFRNPYLYIEALDEANSEHIYPSNFVVPGRWKFFRLRVTNKQLPKLLSWFLSRETAESVHAKIIFIEINKTMKGRWAGTLELPFASPLDRQRLANYPEPETVFIGTSVILDVFAKYENDSEAYGWNNEAYLYRWRTPHYKLDPGDYNVEVELIGVNSRKRDKFKAHIGSTIEETYISRV